MMYKTLGSSGVRVTELGLGMAALGRPGYINLGHKEDLEGDYDVEAMEAHAHEVLDAAWRHGIRYFDAARSYGRAEQFLSTWLSSRSINPQEVTVGSKWGYTYTAGWKTNAAVHEVKEHSLNVLRKQFDESQSLLDPYLALYQIHSATLESGVLTNQEVLSALRDLRESGLQIGLSLSGPRQADTLHEAMKIRVRDKDGPLFTAVQATWNLLAQEAGPALAEAHRLGMGVIVKEALANGRLTKRNQEVPFATKRHKLEEIAQEGGSTIDAVALAAALEQPWADVVLSGAATVEHIQSNVNALALKNTLDTEELLQFMIESPATYWSKRDALEWN